MVKCYFNSCYLYQTNEILNRFLLTGDKFIPEIYLKQPGFTYSACPPLANNKEKLQKFVQTGNTNYIDKNDLDQGCFQHDKAYSKYRDLTKRTGSGSVWREKVLNCL